jgi:hypothetical protein
VEATGTCAKAQMIGELNGSPVLTIAESPDFARQGGIAKIYMEGNRMRVRSESRRGAQGAASVERQAAQPGQSDRALIHV